MWLIGLIQVVTDSRPRAPSSTRAQPRGTASCSSHALDADTALPASATSHSAPSRPSHVRSTLPSCAITPSPSTRHHPLRARTTQPLITTHRGPSLSLSVTALCRGPRASSSALTDPPSPAVLFPARASVALSHPALNPPRASPIQPSHQPDRPHQHRSLQSLTLQDPIRS